MSGHERSGHERPTNGLETVGRLHREGGHSPRASVMASSVAYITPRLGGTINFVRVAKILPTVKGLPLCSSRFCHGASERPSQYSPGCSGAFCSIFHSAKEVSKKPNPAAGALRSTSH